MLPKKLKGTPLNFFTCADCGYTKTYVDSKGLENINKFRFFIDENIEE